MSKRLKNINWDLPESFTWEHVGIALLMDIRDELKALNLLLHCPNFTRVPSELEAIRRNTAKPRKPKK